MDCSDAPCSVQWLDSLAMPIAGATNFTETGFTAGLYIAQVTNGSGCIAFDSTEISQPDSISVMATVTNLTCNGVCDGSVSIVPSGGVGPYTFTWSTGGTANTENNLCADTVMVVVTDATGCSNTFEFILTEPSAIDLSNVSSTPVTCSAFTTGTATVFPTGGTVAGGYTYSWANCNTGLDIGQFTQQAVNLPAGDFCVTVTDDNGCSVTSAPITVADPGAINITFNTTDVSCNGECDGSIEAVVTGGTPNYNFQWFDAAMTPIGANIDNLMGLCSGDYFLTVTDLNGCSVGPIMTTVQEPIAIDPTATATNETCFGACDGSVTATAIGGQGGVSFQWFDFPGNTPVGIGMTLNNLCAGDYYAVASDLAGCLDTSAIVTIAPAIEIVPNATATAVLCNGDCNGTVNAAPTGGNGGFSFAWTDLSTGMQIGTNASVSNLCPGEYSVLITDVTNCTVLDTVTVGEPTPLCMYFPLQTTVRVDSATVVPL